MKNRAIGTWVWVGNQLHTVWLRHHNDLSPIAAKELFLNDIQEATSKDQFLDLGRGLIRAREITAVFFET